MRKSSAFYRTARTVKYVRDESIRIAHRIMGRKFCLPNFLIVGAQKAATTALYEYLLQHPSIAGGVTKEVHFFDHRFLSGVPWYKSNFLAFNQGVGSSENSIMGEASPYYLAHPFVPERVHTACPDVKLIVLLRDPVARAISQYEHERKRGFEKLSLHEALHAECERIKGEVARLADPGYRSYPYEHYTYVTRGLYADQLRCWFEHFPVSQLLILDTKQLRDDPAIVLNKVAKFLDVDQWKPNLTLAHNQGDYPKPIKLDVDWLRTRFEEPNRDLTTLLGRQFSWSMMDGGT